jgi:hypothetical protein
VLVRIFNNNKTIKQMKKLLSLAVLAVAVVGSAVAQLSIPGAIFADNPSRFNGRKVTLKEVKLVASTVSNTNGAIIAPTPLTGTVLAAPGPIGTPSAPNVAPCRAPRGFSQVEVFFVGKPEYKACFFMSDAMKNQLDRELGGQSVEAQITFRGDARTGYNVSFYRLGQ